MIKELVSIIMPLFNGELHVKESINSVLNQEYINWELIIIDDCSTDRSREVVKEYTRNCSKIKLLQTNINQGPAYARNMGIQEAKGDYISFLDSDDVWFPNKLKAQIDFIKKTNAELIFSNYEKISHAGKKANRVIYLPNKVTYKDILKSNFVPCLTALYNVKKLGKHFQNTDKFLISYEDYLMWVSILKNGIIAYNTNQTLAYYRLSEKSISRNKFKMLTIRWHLYRNIEKLSIYQSIYFMINYLILGLKKYLT